MSVHTRAVMNVLGLVFCLLLAGSTSATGSMPTTSTPPQGLSASDWTAIRAQMSARQYSAQRAIDGNLVATNPAHGWHVANVPLTLMLALNTNLTATIAHNALQQHSAGGATRIRYAGLMVWDADHAHDLSPPAVFAEHLGDVNNDGHTDLVIRSPTLDSGLAQNDTQAGLTCALTGGHRTARVRCDRPCEMK